MKYRVSTLTLACAFILAAVNFGCASNPQAVHPPTHFQEKITAVDHWNNIAIDAAERVVLAYERRDDLIAKPVYIKPPNNLPFPQVFYELLRTNLVKRGMQVSYAPEPDSVLLEFDVQAVLHNSSNILAMPSLRSLGIVVVSLVSNSFASPSKHEIIVNVRAYYNNRFVMHTSTVAYINDADWEHYISSLATDRLRATSRVIHVTNK